MIKNHHCQRIPQPKPKKFLQAQSKDKIKLIHKRNQSPLRNHISEKCSIPMMKKKRCITQIKENLTTIPRKKDFQEMKKPQGDQNFSIFQHSEEFNPQIANPLTITLKQIPAQEFENDLEKRIGQLERENVVLREKNRQLQENIFGKKEIFDCLLQEIKILKDIIASSLSPEQTKSQFLPNSLASLTFSKLELTESRGRIAEDIYKKLLLISALE